MDSIFDRFASAFIIGAFILGGGIALLVYHLYLQSKRAGRHKGALAIGKSRITDIANAFLSGHFIGDPGCYVSMLGDLISTFESAKSEGPTEYGIERAERASGCAYIIYSLLSANRLEQNQINLPRLAQEVEKFADSVQAELGASPRVGDKHIIDSARKCTKLDGKAIETLTPEETSKYTSELLKQLVLLQCLLPLG